LPKLQMQIISNASRYVKKGGRLLYSTCTVFKEENEDIVNWFLDNNKNFRVVMDGDKKAVKTFLPYIDGTDGFFACVLERI